MPGPVTSLESASERSRAAHLGPERRRPLVLDAAMGLFLEHGYEGASMEEIARAAGVSKPVLYDCFDGKAALFRALYQREDARVMAEVRAALPEGEVEDPETALFEGFAAFLRAVAAAPDAYRVILLGEGGMGAGLARRVRARRGEQVAAAAEAARRWLDPTGRMSDRDAALFGELTIGLGEAGARTLLADRGLWTPESLAPRLARVAAAALPSG